MKKRIIKKIFLLVLLSVLLLGVVTATDTNDTTGDTTSNDNIQQSSIEKTEINTNMEYEKEGKNLKKESYTISVSNYTQLVDSINEARTSNYDDYTINLESGDYNATDSISWGDSDNTKTLTINGNGIILDGQNTNQFICVYSEHTLNLENITLTNYQTYNRGGAIYNYGTLNIVNSIISNCHADDDGGAIQNDGWLNINNSTFTDNSANDDGGVIYNNGVLDINNSSFNNNTAGYWGGVVCNSGTLTINNSKFEKYNAGVNGGAIYNHQTMTVSNSVFDDEYEQTFYGECTIINCTYLSKTVIEMNTSLVAVYGENITINAYLRDTLENRIPNAQITLTINGEEYTVDTDENGEITYEYQPNDVDTCNVTLYYAGNDIFYSSQANIIIKLYDQEQLASNNMNVTNYQELVDAVTLAKMIDFTEYTINLLPGDYNVTTTITWDDSANVKTLTINGNGLAVDGQNLYRFFIINEGYALVLNNITVQNCAGDDIDGGAISSTGMLNCTNCYFINNRGNNNCAGAIGCNGVTIISNSTFINNHAVGDSGGAIGFSSQNVTIIDSQFINNSGGSYGGAIYIYWGSVTVIDSEFINNYAYDDGGAIYGFGDINAINCTFTNNSASDHGAVSQGDYWTNKVYVINSTCNNNTGSYSSIILSDDTCVINTLIDDVLINKGFGTRIYSYLDEVMIKEEVISINGYIIDYEYNPISDTNITITINGESFITTTNDFGEFSYEYNTGSFTQLNISITYNGTEYYNKAELNQSIILLEESELENNIINVTNYQQLLRAIEIAKVIDYSEYTINLLAGDYNATKSIIWGDSQHATTLTINGNDNTIDGNDTYRFIALNEYYSLILNDMTLTHFNNSGDGGAIFTSGDSNLIVNNTIFENNYATEHGSAIESNGVTTIYNSEFINNTVGADGIIRANGWWDESSLTIVDSIFIDNKCSIDGVILTYVFTNVTNTTFINNQAADDGSAIKAYNTVIVSNSEFINNTANNSQDNWYDGGAISIDADLTLNNCTFINNNARGEAGAIGSYGGSLNVINSTFINNTGGVEKTIVVDEDRLTISNTTIDGQLIKTKTKLSIDTDAVVSTEEVITINIVVMDKHENTIPGAAVTVTINEEEYNITTDDEGTVTYQYQPTSEGTYNITVAYAGDEVYAQSQANTTVEVLEASQLENNIINVTNYEQLLKAVKIVKLIESSEYTINLLAGEYIPTETINWGDSQQVSTLTINGNGNTIDGQDKYQFIIVNEDYTLILANITLNNFTADDGGAILSYGSLEVINSSFNNNHVESHGGAIYADGDATIINSTFNNNNGGTGGAINQNGNTLTVINSTFANDTSSHGGAINIDFANLIVLNSTFINNSRSAIRSCFDDPVDITDSTFINNYPRGIGGAVEHEYDDNFHLTNCNIDGDIISTPITDETVFRTYTSISLDVKKIVTVNNNLTITGYVEDSEYDIGISNAIITLTINDVEYNITTDDEGYYNYIYTPTIVGDNNITVCYNGDEKYKASTTATTIEVSSKIITYLYLYNIYSTNIGNNITIHGYLEDDNGTSITDTLIVLDINGEEYTLTTNSNGEFSYDYTTNIPGINNVTAMLRDNDDYRNSNMTRTWKVNLNYDLSLDIDYYETFYVGDEIVIAGVLTNNSQPCANADINILLYDGYWQDTTLINANVTTDENGIYTISYTPTARCDDAYIRVLFTDEIEDEHTQYRDINIISPYSLTMAINEADSYYIGENISITGKLTYKGENLENTDINLVIYDDYYEEKIFDTIVTTDENGDYEFNYTVPDNLARYGSDYIVRVSYEDSFATKWVTIVNKTVSNVTQMNVTSYDELIDAVEIAKHNLNNMTINLLPGDYNITQRLYWSNSNGKTLTINGNGIIIDGNSDYGFINIENAKATLDNITVINCNDQVIYIADSNVVVNNSLFENNYGYYGGVIYGYKNSNLTVENSQFNNNNGDDSGAIYLRSNNTVNVNNSIFINNIGDQAGAIYGYDGNFANISNSVFINNTKPTLRVENTLTNTTIIQDKTSTRVTVYVDDVNVGNRMTISGSLQDIENWNDLSGMDITIIINGVDYYTTTDYWGEYYLEYVAEVLGTNNVTVIYEGNDDYENATAQKTFEVSKISTRVTVNVNDIVMLGKEVTISGSLEDTEDWNDLYDMDIVLSINGVDYYTTTNDWGEYRLVYVPEVLGTNNVTVIYEGNDYYDNATAQKTFEVSNKTGTYIYLSGMDYSKLDNNIRISGYLRDEDENYLSNMVVTLDINGELFNVTTDEYGEFAVDYTPTMVGTNNVTAYFEENDYYRNSSYSRTWYVYLNYDLSLDMEDDETFYAGEAINITGVLLNNTQPCANADINILIRGYDNDWDYIILLDTDVTTDENGIYNISYTPTTNSRGSSIRVSFTDEIDDEHTQYRDINIISPYTLTMQINNADSYYIGENISITGKLTYKGENVEDAYIYISIYDDYSEEKILDTTITTDENGDYAYNYTIPDNLARYGSDYIVKVSYEYLYATKWVTIVNKTVSNITEINVTNYDELIDAVETAKHNLNNMTINLLLGDYNITQRLYWSNSNGKTLTINGNGIIIDGNSDYGFINIENAKATLDNITVINCYSNVIYIADSNVVVNNSLFENNYGYYGGVIYGYKNSNLTVENSQFNNNNGDDSGAIYLRSNNTVNVNNSIFINNIGDQAGAIYGYDGNFANINNSVFINNTRPTLRVENTLTNTTIIQDKISTSVTINVNDIVTAGKEMTISGYLEDMENWYEISGMDIIVIINGEQYYTTTNDWGEYYLNYVPEVLGTNNVTVIYEGNDDYENATAQKTFEVSNKTGTYIYIWDMGSSKLDNNVRISGYLRDEDDNYLSNMVVTLDINGELLNVTTDGEGDFAVDYTATDVGTNNVTAYFEENDYYRSSNYFRTWYVYLNYDLSLNIENYVTFYVGEEINITGVLLNNSQPCANANINILIDGYDNNWDYISFLNVNVTTDENGIYNISYTPTTPCDDTRIRALFVDEIEDDHSQYRYVYIKPLYTLTMDVNNEYEYYVGENVEITGKLRYKTENVENADINLSIYDVNSLEKIVDVTIKTDENGDYSYIYQVPNNLSYYGNYIVKVSFNDLDRYADITLENKTVENMDTINVHNYDELLEAVGSIRHMTIDQVTINLLEGNYNATGTITFDKSYNNKNITINGNGNTLNGKHEYQFMIVYSNVTLENIILRNFTSEDGGTIYNTGVLNINNSTITDSYSYGVDGGAIFNRGQLNINNSVLSNNTADDWGGAICNYGNVNIVNSTFTYNKASTGGSIYNSGNLNIINSTFNNNTPINDGGGLYTRDEDDTCNIINSIIDGELTNSNNTKKSYIYLYVDEVNELGDIISIEGELNSGYGGIEDVEITITINDKNVTTTTDSEGKFSYGFTPEATGTYDITAIYEGSEYYLESSTSTSVEVIDKYELTLEFEDDTTVYLGENLTITGVLLNNSQPCANALINISIYDYAPDGMNFVIFETQVKTDNNGRYTLNYTPEYSVYGSYIVVSFKGKSCQADFNTKVINIYASSNGTGNGLSIDTPTDLTTALQMVENDGIIYLVTQASTDTYNNKYTIRPYGSDETGCINIKEDTHNFSIIGWNNKTIVFNNLIDIGSVNVTIKNINFNESESGLIVKGASYHIDNCTFINSKGITTEYSVYHQNTGHANNINKDKKTAPITSDNVVIIENCIFINCTTAIKNNVTNTRIIGNTFINNTEHAIRSNLTGQEGSNILIANNTFIDNKGGAISVSTSNSIIVNNSFENNTSNENGGAIYDGGYNSTIENNTFINNRALKGGAIYKQYNYMNVDNNKFIDNTAGTGSVLYSQGSVTLTNNDMKGNIVTEDDGKQIVFQANPSDEAYNQSSGISLVSQNNEIDYSSNNDDLINDDMKENFIDNNNVIDKDKLIDTRINAVIDNDVIGNVSINITLADADNNKIANATIIVLDDNNKGIANTTTDANGEATIKLNLTSGNHTVNVVYGGNGTYNASQNQVTINVAKLNATVTLDVPASAYVGDTVTINVGVKDQNNNVVTADVTIKVDNTTIGTFTLNNGQISTNTTINTDGIHNITVTINENENITTNTTTKTIQVNKKNTKVNATATSSRVDNTTIAITVTDLTSSNVIANPLVIVYENNKEIANTTTGTVKLNLTAGTHTLDIKYDSNATYNASETQLTVNVAKLNATVTLNVPASAYVGDSVTINVSVKDQNNNVVTGDVTIKVDNTVIGTFTLNNGQISTNTTINTQAVHNITATYNGNTNTSNATAKKTVQINKKNTKVNATATSSRVDNTTIAITVTDLTSSNAIANPLVIIYENNKEIANTTTGTVKLNLMAGSHTLNIKYDGNNIYNASQTQLTVNVVKLNSTITLNAPTTAYAGDTITINVSVKDQNNNAATGNVTIKVDNTVIGTLTLNNGQISTSTSINTQGTHNITATYNGNANTNTATDKKTIQVDKKNTKVNATVTSNRVDNTTIAITVTDITSSNAIVNPLVLVYENGKQIANTTTGTVKLNLTGGSHTLNIKYDGNNIYNASQTQLTVNVVKLNSTITLNAPTTAYAGNSITINVSVKDQNNNAATGNVTIKVDNTVIGTLTLNNGQISTSTSINTQGTHNITATYNGNANTNTATDKKTIRVDKKNTKVNATVTSNRVDNTTIAITVTDITSSNAIVNPLVLVYENGKQIANTSTNTVKLNLTAGSHTLNLKYDGNNIYNASQTTLAVNVAKLNATVSLTAPTTAYVGNKITITVNVKDQNNNAATGNVTIKVDNTTIGTQTLNNGQISTTTTINTQAAHNITATYNGNAKTNTATAKKTIQVNKKNTSLNATVKSTIPDNTTVDVKLTDNNNKAVSKANIIVTDKNNKQIATSTTDANGKATIKLNLASGKQNINIKYNGNNTYNPTNKTLTINVDKLNTTINIKSNNTSPRVNDKVQLTITLKDNNNKAMTNKTIEVTVNNKNYNVTTDNTGTTTVNYTMNKNYGNLTATATYNGDSTYKESTKTITLNRTYTTDVKLLTGSFDTKPGDTVKLIAHITDNGLDINGGQLVFKIDGKTLADESGQAVKVNIQKGFAILEYKIPDTLSAGTRNLSASFSSGKYSGRLSTPMVINKLQTHIDVNPLYTTNNNIIVKAQVVDQNNQALNKQTAICIKFNGKSYNFNTTTGTINYKITQTLKDGYYNLTIISGANGKYLASTVNTVLIKSSTEIKTNYINNTLNNKTTANSGDIKTGTYMSLLTGASTVKPGDVLKLIAHVTKDSIDITGGQLGFKIDGLTLTDSKNNKVFNPKDGLVILEYKVPDTLSAGTRTLSAVYSSKQYGNERLNSTLTMNKLNTHIESEPLYTTSATPTIKAQILDDNNQLINKETNVVIKIDGKSYSMKNSNGIISYKVPTSLSKGLHQITIIAGENGKYLSSRANTVVIRT